METALQYFLLEAPSPLGYNPKIHEFTKKFKSNVHLEQPLYVPFFYLFTRLTAIMISRGIRYVPTEKRACEDRF